MTLLASNTSNTAYIIFNYICIYLTIKFMYTPRIYSLRPTVWKCWKQKNRKLDIEKPNFLPATLGSCIMATHQTHCIWLHLSYRKQFLVGKKSLFSYDTKSIHCTRPCVDFFLCLKENTKKNTFWQHWYHQEYYNSSSEFDYINLV